MSKQQTISVNEFRKVANTVKDKKSFKDYLGPEDLLQHAVLTWFSLQYPKIRFHHSPDAGKRSDFEQFKYKYVGGGSGFLDIIIPEYLICIEFKIKPNKPTIEQLEWLKYLKSIGWNAEVFYNFEDTKKWLIKIIEK